MLSLYAPCFVAECGFVLACGDDNVVRGGGVYPLLIPMLRQVCPIDGSVVLILLS